MDHLLETASPEGFRARRLEKEDFNKGYITLLSHLTEVGEISEDLFNARFSYILQHSDLYNIIVLEDIQTNALAATATLLIEHKFIRKCGKVGHIEDIVVNPEYRGRHLGTSIIHILNELAQINGCYKVILDCTENLQTFYEGAQLERKAVCMARYFK